jgi:hypothetical protein
MKLTRSASSSRWLSLLQVDLDQGPARQLPAMVIVELERLIECGGD